MKNLIMESSRKQFILNKGGHRYIFRFTCGNEASFLDALVAAAENEQTDFNWLDASVLSSKFSQDVMEQTDEMLYRDLFDPMQILP